MSDVKFMREALAEACKAFDAGEIPIGAVVVRDGEVIGRGRNRREELASPLAHAETVALENAAKKLSNWRFDDCTLYVTLEPCVMCAGAAVQCRLTAIVYGAPDPKTGGCGSLYDIPSDGRMYHNCSVRGGVLKEECAEILRRFFETKRS